MSGNRSIGQRLRRAGSQEVIDEIVREWTADWRREHDALIRDLERAVSAMDYDALCRATGQLKASNAKRHHALPMVLDSLVEREA